MRFLLDNDVDARLAGVLRAHGHEAWTAADIGISEADDDEIAFAAQARQAVCVTHDKAFAARARRHTIGPLIRLRCPEPDAVDVMCRWLDEVVAVLSRKPKVLVLGKTKIREYAARW